jgi:predicted  nucleic acid-binding Zn-ribbon protein
MSPIGRIFSVLNLVLAALFLSWASMALSSADSFRQQLTAETNAHLSTKETLEAEKSAALTAKASAESRASSLNDQLETVKNDVARLVSEIAEKDQANSVMQADLGRISNALEAANSSRDSATEAQLAAIERANTADQDKSQALSAKQSAESQVADLRAQIAALNSQLSDKNADIVQLQKDLDNKSTELAVLIDATGVDAGSIIGMPLINGVVIEALYDVEPGLVAINKGTADKVERGYTFDIYNGADYKGRVRVENVRENTCTAIVTQPVDGKRIGQGDKAATRL